MGPFQEVAHLAAVQHGVVTRGQALACGATTSAVKRWVAAGRLQPVHRGVHRIAGAPVTWEQRLLAAVLAAGDGAAASHRSAARLWGMLDHDVVEVTVPAHRAPDPSRVVIHRSSDLGPADVVRRNAIPTTTPMRALVDLGAVVAAERVEDALDHALRAHLVTAAGVERALDEVARRGRTGAGVLREVLDRRALGAERAESLLESRMARLLRRGGLPPAASQHVVRGGGRFVARVDFAYPAVRLALEVDGFAAHSSPRALQSDLDRQNSLVELGWTVLRFTWPDVVRRPDTVVARVRRVLADRSVVL